MHLDSPFPDQEESPANRRVNHQRGPEGLNRRVFTQALAGILAAPLAAAPLAAESTIGSSEADEKPEDLSSAEWSEVQGRFNNLLRVYGARLSTDQRHTLLNVLIGNERMLTSIRKFAVQNSEPAALTLRLVEQGRVL